MRVWKNPQGCKVISMDSLTCARFFSRHESSGSALPYGIYHLLDTNQWFAVDLSGLRTFSSCKLPITKEKAMSLRPIDPTSQAGEICNGGAPLHESFEFEMPDDVKHDMSAHASAVLYNATQTRSVLQIPVGKARDGKVVRKSISDCWTGQSFVDLKRSIDRWIRSLSAYPTEDVLFHSTCQLWKRIGSMPSVACSVHSKTLNKQLTSIVVIPTVTSLQNISWKSLTLFSGCSLQCDNGQTIAVNHGNCYKVDGQLRARLHFSCPVKFSNTILSCKVQFPTKYECTADVNEVMNNIFLRQLVAFRVAVLHKGRIRLWVSPSSDVVAVASVLAQSFWGIFIVASANAEAKTQSVKRVVHMEAPRYVKEVHGPRKIKSRNHKLKAPPCLRHASKMRDGPLINRLRLDISSIVKKVYVRTRKNLATPAFYKHLVNKGNFKDYRVESLKKVIERDISDAIHKDVGILSCQRRLMPELSAHKLKCPFHKSSAPLLVCARKCGHGHLDTLSSVQRFNPADMAVGYKIPTKIKQSGLNVQTLVNSNSFKDALATIAN